eukprot:TRINITY_DN437_c0_g1_i1.p1 TRINITY_DN437_c0_g1~~TRINITY_DN437_c0_g1_i1.p1  ORF type:complete len:1056 (-),score=389.88 TRINITY_DN437_c0_g1_i1:223-3369(-)
MSETKEPDWIRIQSKTFRNWCNTHLKHRMLSIQDLRTDLANGILLINLVEIISSKQVNNGKYVKNPKMRTQMFENNGLALKFLQNEGLKLVNIGNEDIVDGNHKLILGLIWTIILRYQINITEGKSARTELLNWVRKKIPERTINNFDHDWNDGTLLCGLVDALKSAIPNWRELDKAKALENLTLGAETAEKEMGIEQIIAPEDLSNPEVDELSVMTYIALFKEWEDKQASLKETVDPHKTTVTGPGVEGGRDVVVRKPAPFTITAKNAFNDLLGKGGAPFKVTVTGPTNANVPANITDNGDGTYSGSYTPTTPGTHVVRVEHNSIPVAQTPYNVEIDAGVDASKTAVTGPAVEPYGAALNQPAKGTIQARDSDGKPVTSGGAPFVVKVEGPNNSSVESPVTDNGDGTYGFTYTPNALGPHVVTVQLEDKNVAQSPYNVSVHELVDPSKTRVSGPGVNPSVPEGVPTYVTIEAVGPQGDIKTGGAKFDVQLETPNGQKQSVPVKDNGDGTYRADYTPTQKGKNVVHVDNHGPAGVQAVANSPYPVEVREPADKTKTEVSGPGVRRAVPMGPTHVKVEARDKNGNPIGKGGDHVTVEVKGPNGDVPVELKDNGDGTYVADYEPTALGPHTVEVKLVGDHVAKSPYHVTVRDPADKDKTEVSGPGIKTGIPNGVPTWVDIVAKDSNGDPITSGNDNFAVQVQGPNGPVDVELVDNDDGTYKAKYTPTDLGDHVVEVKLGQDHVANSPYNVLSRAPAHPKNTEIKGPGVKDGVPEQVETFFDILAKDADGKDVEHGGDRFQVEVTGPNNVKAPATVNDNEDGTYHVTYTAPCVGPFTVEVTLQDEHVADSAYKLKVRERGDASKSTAEGPGLVHPTQNVPQHFKVTVRDRDGNDLAYGGDLLKVNITGPEGVQVDATVEDKYDGKYRVDYTPLVVGDHVIEILLNGDHIAKSPYQVYVDEEADADESGLENFSFGIVARRKNGEQKPRGGDQFAVKIQRKEPAEDVEGIQIKDRGDGRYRVTYSLPGEGEYLVNITLNGRHIKGSPWRQNL